ncbi:hypothetical protein CLAFUW4_03380 [Fulvia fulva]|uniref:Uncharacterized protein n=1 Tax=Passalora fulva TaxID=5499 RepID=A0A1P8YXR2_PASFU|nr:uncharacterized protein CLAFUR5_03360 [Fulvia fulva]AQA29304.1 hypothetical protein 11 [Fulvia fulva]KAK4631176.1 hypothetical protein CLAFUR4_03369 [Fulvia fulva]KAK4633139.1 hypothetical protein CLAFUR0_03374 [Fulvia fulva]UJO14368.1 hypothetical protein CLAFUR5_03360 [Fulvia fulva]WPV11709.1 hypothetical protein CLAFUW4_03380 [Fulvia fulva]
MKHTITTILLSAAIAYAQTDDSSSETYISSVCAPTNSTGFPDWNAPCNAAQAIQVQCMYGESYFQELLNQYGNPGKRQARNEDVPMQPNAAQRTCICQSQFWNQANGCADCYKGHGLSEAEAGITNKDITSISSQYCAASSTPTLGLADWLFQYADSMASASPTATAKSSSFSDPIANKTEVSLYFTPSVTGSAAYIVAQATGSATSKVNSVSGQIRPTAGGRASGTTSGNGAGKTEAAAVAGLIGVAGLVALL